MSEEPSRDSYSKIEEANSRYWGSEKGKSTKKKYDLSEKGKGARRKYLRSEKGQMALLRYYLSEKGVATRQLRNEMNKLLTQCAKYLEENPNHTITDFLSTLGDHQGGE